MSAYEMIAEKYGEDPLEAQKKYCSEHGWPSLIPDDGFCPWCGENIFKGRYGIGLETAGSRLITSCPWCRKSFCD